MEIERETPGSDRGRSWRSNTAEDQDAKKLEESYQFIKVCFVYQLVVLFITLAHTTSSCSCPVEHSTAISSKIKINFLCFASWRTD
jgi:hypothetical protein